MSTYLSLPSLLLASFAPPLQGQGEEPPFDVNPLEEWGAYSAEEQQRTLPDLFEILAPSVEMDICLKGEVVIRSKSVEVAQAVLDFESSVPEVPNLVPHVTAPEAIFDLYALPDYSRVLRAPGGGHYAHDAILHGKFQLRVLEFLDATDVEIIVAPADLAGDGASGKELEPERVLASVRERWKLQEPDPDFRQLFPNGRVEGEPSTEQLLALGRYGAHLVHWLSREDVELAPRYDEAFVTQRLQRAESEGKSNVALLMEIYSPGTPKLPTYLGPSEEAPAYSILEAQWTGARLFLHWRLAHVGVVEVLDRILFDFGELARYLAAKEKMDVIAPTEKQEGQWNVLYQSWLLTVQKAEVVPLAAAAKLTEFEEVHGAKALEQLLERRQDFVTYPGEFDLPDQGIDGPKAFLLQWAEAKKYPEELLEKIRSSSFEELEQPSQASAPAGD